MAQAEENTTEDKNTFIEASPVNDKAVKRLLRQKKPLTGTQVGRIVFLNVCEMAEGNKEIYNFDDSGMSYQNAGMAYAYDSSENRVLEYIENRSGRRKMIEKKMEIKFIDSGMNCVGDKNNIKMRG